MPQHCACTFGLKCVPPVPSPCSAIPATHSDTRMHAQALAGRERHPRCQEQSRGSTTGPRLEEFLIPSARDAPHLPPAAPESRADLEVRLDAALPWLRAALVQAAHVVEGRPPHRVRAEVRHGHEVERHAQHLRAGEVRFSGGRASAHSRAPDDRARAATGPEDRQAGGGAEGGEVVTGSRCVDSNTCAEDLQPISRKSGP